MKYGVDGMVTKKGVGLQHFCETKRCSFVRFENRHEIKCYIPISFFLRVKNEPECP